MYNEHPEYPERTKYDKKARNYRYKYDIDFKKYHWNDLTLKERDYWRGLVQIDEDYAKEKFQGRHARDERARRQKNKGIHRRTHLPKQGG